VAVGGSAAAVLGAGALSGCGAGLGGVEATPIDGAPTSLDPYFPGHGAGGFLVNHYALDLRYVPATNQLLGTATIRIAPFAALSGLGLDLTGPIVDSARVNGVAVAYTQDPALGAVHLVPPAVLPAGRLVTVELRYHAQPGTVNVKGIGDVGWRPTAANGSGVDTPTGAGVVALPIGAPCWFPCADHPSIKAAYEISVTVPGDLRVLANGRLVSKSPATLTEGPGSTGAGSAGGTSAGAGTGTSAGTGVGATRWTYRHDGPMAGYLATVQIGDFTVVTASGPKNIQIRNAYPQRIAAQAEYDLARQSQMITTFSELFGDYPFDVFGTAVVDGLSVSPSFGAQTLALLDPSLIDGKRTHEGLVARALATQWFGASVSVADWRQSWLNEGFPTYAQWLWSEKSGGVSADEPAGQAMSRLRQLPQDIFLADPGAARITDERLGLRGACYLHTLRLIMGDQVFFQLLRVWCGRNQSGSAATDDLTQLIPQIYTAADLSSLSSAWLYAVALPELPPPSSSIAAPATGGG
jgi:aminopeptidase N